MKAKPGKVINAIVPAVPEEVFLADEADPGKAASAKAKQVSGQQGKYGKQEIKPFKPATDDANKSKEEEKPTPDSWVEISLCDEENNPVAGQKYEIELPDGSVAKGTTDANGKVKVEGFEPGKCKLTLPELHPDAW